MPTYQSAFFLSLQPEFSFAIGTQFGWQRGWLARSFAGLGWAGLDWARLGSRDSLLSTVTRGDRPTTGAEKKRSLRRSVSLSYRTGECGVPFSCACCCRWWKSGKLEAPSTLKFCLEWRDLGRDGWELAEREGGVWPCASSFGL
jgi:hypothetical protein